MTVELRNPAWKTWRGKEVGNFMANECDLPQYSLTATRNFSGGSLSDLRDHGMMSKGLARAGIYNLDHQRRIASALSDLEGADEQELTRASSTPSLHFPPVRPPAKFTPSTCVSKERFPHLIGYTPPTSRCNLMVKDALLCPTAKLMQQRSASTGALLGPPGHFSQDRPSFKPYFPENPLATTLQKGKC
eukprot:CAMPEP_0203861048 /NCGR_PEP_ID=MMETSP0359-20131031/12784_1 /ASSEMBLY_ACC=CAM_ASM_000338 /TAXON_ID=268821 /ORGANISM="Scrippsiella Hangoei, Strain SHTV-5" /LENGTH=188 /DNA_ID=CAMNT_0050778221 /DNA_START=59 /DNA_END=625 /DNA_ORIENTATION=+